MRVIIRDNRGLVANHVHRDRLRRTCHLEPSGEGMAKGMETEFTDGALYRVPAIGVSLRPFLAQSRRDEPRMKLRRQPPRFSICIDFCLARFRENGAGLRVFVGVLKVHQKSPCDGDDDDAAGFRGSERDELSFQIHHVPL